MGMGEKIKILICDDSKLMRRKLSQALEKKYDVVVLEADNGQMGVELYRSEKPDLVFMDIVMPVMDGVTALKEIIAIDPRAKIVMSTSTGTKEKLKTALEAGAIEFIQKPWTEGQIEAMMEKIVKERESHV